MNATEAIQILQKSRGNEAALALALVDLRFHNRSDAVRQQIREALEAAAIPHWFTPEILASLLSKDLTEARRCFDDVCSLTIVERFSARGENAANVHESSRLALRKQLHAMEPNRFRHLSHQAASCFAGEKPPHIRIEHVYHQLVSGSEGLSGLEALQKEWGEEVQPEVRQAAIVAFTELTTQRLLRAEDRAGVLAFVALLSKPRPVRMFLSYSHENAAWCKRLLPLLRVKANVDTLQPWHDTELKAGDRCDKEIRAELERTDIFLCLVSYQYLASDYIQHVELPIVKKRHMKGEIEVVPVILYPIDLQRDSDFLCQFNPLPKWGKSWLDFERDGDWRDALYPIGEGVKRAIEKTRLR